MSNNETISSEALEALMNHAYVGHYPPTPETLTLWRVVLSAYNPAEILAAVSAERERVTNRPPQPEAIKAIIEGASNNGTEEWALLAQAMRRGDHSGATLTTARGRVAHTATRRLLRTSEETWARKAFLDAYRDAPAAQVEMVHAQLEANKAAPENQAVIGS